MRAITEPQPGHYVFVRCQNMVGWVQQIGLAPAIATADDNQEYGSGAFHLAGSEVVKIAKKKP